MHLAAGLTPLHQASSLDCANSGQTQLRFSELAKASKLKLMPTTVRRVRSNEAAVLAASAAELITDSYKN